VRGGAIPLLAWAGLLTVLLALNWAWTGDAIQIGSFALAVLVVGVGAGLLALTGRQALRRGPPQPATDPEAIPEASLAAVIVALSLACMLFGLVWARFLVYFGAGVLVLALGRLVLEVRAQRESRRRLTRERRT
jgi:membrane protein implicated in regulation of membrane protease activity